MIQPAPQHLLSVVPAAPLWSWVAVALAVIFAGVAAYSYLSVRRREETIRRQLARESALKARDDLKDVSVEVKNGVARLTGTVPDSTDRLQASLVVRGARGVRSVQNDLRVATQ